MSNRLFGSLIVIICLIKVYDFITTGCIHVTPIGEFCDVAGKGALVGFGIFFIGGIYLLWMGNGKKND